jgi:hypothetical protein
VSGRSARLLSVQLALHDVRDPEAHVRVLLDSRLAEWGARLDGPAYEDALTYLLELCWELSGLDANGEPRICWWARLFIDAEEIDAGDTVEELGPFPSEIARDRAVETYVCTMTEQPIVELHEGRPRGAYDPAFGLSFSTYSRRILSLRVVDWYRRTFHDSRYGQDRREVSLDAMAERYEARGEAPEQFLDTLAQDPDLLDDVLTRATVAG